MAPAPIPCPAELSETQENRRRSEEHTSELQSPCNLVCRLLLEKKNHIMSRDVIKSQWARLQDKLYTKWSKLTHEYDTYVESYVANHTCLNDAHDLMSAHASPHL